MRKSLHCRQGGSTQPGHQLPAPAVRRGISDSTWEQQGGGSQIQSNPSTQQELTLPCKHASLSCTATFSLQHHGLSSQHWGRWDPTVRARHHGHRAHLRGAAHRGHHPHHRRRLGSVSALQATAVGSALCQFMVLYLHLEG